MLIFFSVIRIYFVSVFRLDLPFSHKHFTVCQPHAKYKVYRDYFTLEELTIQEGRQTANFSRFFISVTCSVLEEHKRERTLIYRGYMLKGGFSEEVMFGLGLVG